MIDRDEIIKKAKFWAASLWSEALPRWSGRSGQDKNYRKHVIHPSVLSLLREYFPDRGIRMLELGCGDGSFLDDYKWSEQITHKSTYLGIDISKELIVRAKKNRPDGVYDFLQGDLCDRTFADYLVNSKEYWDCILSIFVIQEIADIESLMNNLSRILPEDGMALLVAVHPEFAEWLVSEGRMRKADDHIDIGISEELKPSEIPWQWAGYYPIVDEPCEPFYLPYFHRTLDNYCNLLKNTGFAIERLIELPEKKHDIPLLVKQGISPFAPFETNLYWPQIGVVSSSVVFLARKERTGEE